MKKYIDADFLLSKKETVGICDAQGNTYGAAEVIFVEDVDNVGGGDVEEVRHGEWIVRQRREHYPSGKAYEECVCPYCKRADHNGDGLYCGYCGAKMDGGNDERRRETEKEARSNV